MERNGARVSARERERKRVKGKQGCDKENAKESAKSSDQFSKYAVPLRCFLIIVIAIALPAALSVCAALATATIITALSYELLISREQTHAALRALAMTKRTTTTTTIRTYATVGVLLRFLLMKVRNTRVHAPSRRQGS